MKNLLTITSNTMLKGEIRHKGNLKLEGRVEGGGLVEGTLLISTSAVWVGNIVADIIIVEGTVEGNIVARQKLLVLAKARITGKVYCSSVHMEEGVEFTGSMQMKLPAPLGLTSDPFSYLQEENKLINQLSNDYKKFPNAHHVETNLTHVYQQ